MAEIDVIIGQAKKDALESVKAQEAADAAERHATNVAVAAKEAEEIAKDNIEVNYTEDGDIWVDDVDVQSVHPES